MKHNNCPKTTLISYRNQNSLITLPVHLLKKTHINFLKKFILNYNKFLLNLKVEYTSKMEDLNFSSIAYNETNFLIIENSSKLSIGLSMKDLK